MSSSNQNQKKTERNLLQACATLMKSHWPYITEHEDYSWQLNYKQYLVKSTSPLSKITAFAGS